ncbi:MAG TPA: FHA domain-containing protein [Roseiflexaceae bacterium]|nr:FHA domain-containing protein [Roseiflexaceae bacterium]
MASGYGILIYGLRDQQLRTYELRLGSNTIGSGAESDLQLEADGVSRLHARIICTAADTLLIDVGSTNGTFLNQVRLKASVPQPLRHGDSIRIGTVTLRYATARQEASEPAEAATVIQPPAQPAPPSATAAAVPATPPPEIARRVAARRGAAGGPPALPPGRILPRGKSRYMELLPAPYQTDETNFLNRFLLIFESVLAPVERSVGQFHYYFDPRLVPDSLLAWLASWVALVLNERWPIERRRELVARAAELYRWRGTHYGLSEYLKIYTGVTPTIVEPGLVRRADRDPDLPDHIFRVVLAVPTTSHVEQELVEAIIDSEKPAHTSYYLDLRRSGE